MRRQQSIPREEPEPRTAHRRFLRAAILIGGLFLSGGMSAGSCNLVLPWGNSATSGSRTVGTVMPVILASDHFVGDANAPVTVVQYESYESIDCGRFARSEFPTIKQTYIDTGKVRWVYRQFPETSQTRAKPAAYAAECAGDQDKFFEYRDLVYQTTDSTGNTILTDDQLKKNADTLGLNRTTFDPCFTGNGKVSRIQQDINSGTALGVTTAPSFVVDGLLLSGFGTAKQLSRFIDRALNAQ